MNMTVLGSNYTFGTIGSVRDTQAVKVETPANVLTALSVHHEATAVDYSPLSAEEMALEDEHALYLLSLGSAVSVRSSL
jgi:hypothetical protein